MRTFLAIDLPDKIRGRLASFQDSVSVPGAKVKWVRRHQLHVTLHFLGDLDPNRLTELIASVGQVTDRIASFPLEVRGIQAVPPAGRKLRMFWAGVPGRIQPLEQLHAGLKTALEQLGLPVETRKYTPHVTLGRVRFCRNPEPLRKAIAPLHDKHFGLAEVHHVTVYASTLTPKGTEYNVLERCSLTADPGGWAGEDFSA